MSKKILIVEDNPQNMRLVEMALSAERYFLLEATNGEEALEMAKKERPDLIIMDVQLPKMSGLEVTRKLREIPEFSRTPIIAVTAYAMKGDEEKALKSGCNVYLSKPISARDLPNLIAEMLLQRQEGGKG
jgi:two-component system cell cycle response regulator DivK